MPNIFSETSQRRAEEVVPEVPRIFLALFCLEDTPQIYEDAFINDRGLVVMIEVMEVT